MGVVCKESPSAVSVGAAFGLRAPVFAVDDDDERATGLPMRFFVDAGEDEGDGEGGEGEGGGGAASVQRGGDAMMMERPVDDGRRSGARARFATTKTDERS